MAASIPSSPLIIPLNLPALPLSHHQLRKKGEIADPWRARRTTFLTHVPLRPGSVPPRPPLFLLSISVPPPQPHRRCSDPSNSRFQPCRHRRTTSSASSSLLRSVKPSRSARKDTMEMHNTQISQGASSSGLAPTPLSLEDQIEVMLRVFRPGRGYIAGVGPRLPSLVLCTPTDSSQSSQNFGSRMITDEEHNRRIAELEQRFNQQLDERFQQLISILRQSASTPNSNDLLTRLFSPRSPCREDDDAANSRDS